ncbi:MAG: hypothetical protein ABI828_07260 [Actinomycetota bacterium]
MDRELLLLEEAAGWETLIGALGRIPAGRFDEPTLTPEGWSAKDAMFHVGYWLADCARVLGEIDAGTFDRGEEDAIDIEALNAEGFLRSRGMDAEAVRAGSIAAREQAREAFVGLGTTTRDAWEWFDESGPLHYRKHVQDLNTWLWG